MTDLQEKIKTTLQILPHLNFNGKAMNLQKCIIPSEFIPKTATIGTEIIAKCTDQSTGKQYICKLNSLLNNYPANYCHLDESVFLHTDKDISSINDDTTSEKQRKIAYIEILNFDPEPVKEISIIITINENSLKKLHSIPQITYILKNYLQLYILTANAYIKCNSKDEILYGFSDILVTKSSSQSSFKINIETNIKIEDFKYQTNDDWSKRTKITNLEDLDEILLKLDKLLEDMKLKDQINWQIKPSLMTLIIGLSGSGKTSLINNFFKKNSCNVFEIIPANIIGQYPGETEEHLRTIFQSAINFTSIFKPKSKKEIKFGFLIKL